MRVLGRRRRATSGPPEGEYDGVRTVHAAASGDDAIVDQVRTATADGHEVVVVTADRALRERVAAAGGSSLGPSWLLDQLP